jgi:hypothetical protein
MSQKDLEALAEKIKKHGLDDLTKLAPIGDLGYLNCISYYRGDYLRSEMIQNIMDAFDEQREKNGWTVNGGETCWRCTDHYYHCPELGLHWGIDSGD